MANMAKSTIPGAQVKEHVKTIVSTLTVGNRLLATDLWAYIHVRYDTVDYISDRMAEGSAGQTNDSL